MDQLATWLDDWLCDHVRVRLRPLTQLAYARATRNFTQALGPVAPAEITEGRLASIVRAWLAEGRSIQRIRADVRSFSMALEWAAQRGVVPRNVARAVTLPPPPAIAAEVVVTGTSPHPAPRD